MLGISSSPSNYNAMAQIYPYSFSGQLDNCHEWGASSTITDDGATASVYTYTDSMITSLTTSNYYVSIALLFITSLY